MEGGRERQGQLVTGTEEKDHMRLRNESGSMRKVRKMGTWLKRGGERAQPSLIFTQTVSHQPSCLEIRSSERQQ